MTRIAYEPRQPVEVEDRRWMEVGDMYLSGMSLRDIEDVTGVGRETLRRLFKARGILRGRLDYHGPTDARLKSYIGPPDENGCWPWTGIINNKGYGLASINGHGMAAHRAIYELLREPVPRHLDLCHRCDNPPCVNPDHMFVGTRKDNMQDAARKGRTRRGEQAANAKLTEEIVRYIRHLHGSGVNQRKISAITGVDYRHVNAIVLRRIWKYAV